MATILFNTALLTPELVLIVLVGTIGYVSLTTLLSTMGRECGRARCCCRCCRCRCWCRC